jgi:hypothetical protein
MDKPFEILLADGQVVTWNGRDGPDACRRYVNAHRGTIAIAWREPRHGLSIGLLPIVEAPQHA